MKNQLPLILEPELLEQHLADEQCTIVDLSKQENYLKYHIPGACYLDYARIVRVEKPVMGLIPDETTLSRLLADLGATPDSHIIAYDDEGGGKAARLLWTLDLLGHQRCSLLNGGIFSWANEGFRLTQEVSTPAAGHYDARLGDHAVATKQYILEHLHQPQTLLLDCRTPEEYAGIKKFAERGGHIPGAVNIDWVRTMDQNRNLRLKPDAELRSLFESAGVSSDKEIIVYCQTHHRSSHTYIVLKHLGYPNIKGYPGAWSDWGNDPDTPVEQG